MSSRHPRGRPEAGDPELDRRPRARHTFKTPVPVVVRIVWERDGEEHIETEALGWSNTDAYVRLPDSRWRFTSIWLRAEDVKRR